ncbi:MAG: YCF48-related protein [Candidatus Kapabacteria bacterium]|nr:YCF48-related protein [Candidatus Kapabacteria bacterium]
MSNICFTPLVKNNFLNSDYKFKNCNVNKLFGKFFFLFILFFLSNTSTLLSQWSSIKTISQNLNLNSIYAVTPGHIFIATDSATILKSSEGGFNWTRTSGVGGISQSNNLYTIFFIDSVNGWAAGTKGSAVKTTNSGNTWTPMTMADGNITIKQIRFVDSLNGWAVGNSGKIQITTDGGSSWSIQHTFQSVQSINSIYFMPEDAQTIWVAGNSGFIAKSTNEGINWINLNSGTNNDLLCIKFGDRNIGWAVGKSGTILLTVNGGINWISVPSPIIGAGDINSILVSSDGSAIIACSNGRLYETYNFGNTWVDVEPIFNQSINSIFFLPLLLYSVTNGGNIGITYLARTRDEICYDAYNLCLNKCNKGQTECIESCNRMFIDCLRKSSKINLIYY